MHTACVWSEKLPFAEYSVVKERSKLQISEFRFQIGLPNDFCNLPSEICNFTKNLVENTGLEPVTSWLQTRRSPS
jgi:hypothetical protein